MADWEFNGINRIIKEPAGSGDTTFDVKRDIYSAWKRWVASGNSQYDKAFTVEGGTPIGTTGLFTGSTLILDNSWKLMAADHDHQTILIGNLYSSDGIASVNNPIGSGSIFISATVGAQGISTGGSVGGNTVWTEAEKQESLAYSKKASDNAEQIIEKIQ